MRNKKSTIQSLFGILRLDETANILMRLNSGFDVNTVDSGGRTLLMQATIEKNHDLMKILIEHNADVNIRDQRQWTALHFAAQNYDFVSTKLLVENQADLNALDDYGNSVISRALFSSKHQSPLLIKLLLEKGADPSLKNTSGISALNLAQTIGQTHFFE